MSRIDELIAEYHESIALPFEGKVRKQRLSEVCLSITAGGDLPKNFAKGQERPSVEFPYPIFSNGTGPTSLYGYTDSFRVEREAVTISARGTIGHHQIREPRFTPIVRLLVLVPNPELISAKFLNYVLAITEIGSSGGSIPQLTVPAVSKIEIPVPPLEVQREIVQVLDTFTQLEAELEAELEARKQQYEHYRNYLVNKKRFSSTEWFPLSELTTIRTGSKPTAVETEGAVPYINAGTEPSGYIAEFNTQGGVVTIPSRGQGSAGHVGFQNRDFWCGPLCYKVESNSPLLENRFLYFFLRNIQEEIVSLRKVGSIPAVNKSDLGVIRIPAVQIEEQRRIVAILDKFDALVNDLSVGLPAELAARRQQYEYYRDKLLSFREVE